MFDVYWSDQHQTVAESQDQAPVQNKEGARQRPSSRPSFFKQLSGKLQDGGQKTKRSSSALSIRSSNKSTQGLSIASNDGHLPAQELPAYSHEPHELPATEKRAATSLLESPTLEYNKADGQPHSPSTESLASSAGWLNNPDTPNSKRPTSLMSSTSQRGPQSRYHGVSSPRQYSIQRKPTGANTSQREQSLQMPRGLESPMASPSPSTTSHTSRYSNPTILESPSIPNTNTIQKPLSKSAFPALLQERQSEAVTQIQDCEEKRDVRAIGLPPNIVSSDVDGPSRSQPPLSTSNPEIKIAATSPALLASSRRRLKYVESASQKVTLQRLQEIWDNNMDDVFEEVEAEKEWWLYMAYEKLKWKSGQPFQSPRSIEGEISSEPEIEAHNVLFLYHNQLAVDFLTTFTTTVQFYHLLPPTFDTGATTLSLPSRKFHLIHLPVTISSLLPASSLPILLQECARMLCPTLSSSLHLTILDSYPLPQTMGPLLQHWLTTNLLLNLEINFRCLSPGRLIPLWLQKAGFRVEGNCQVRQFLGTKTNDQDQIVEVGDRVAIELEVEVGRRLWWMVWGPFVQERVRWWDDEEIVKECERMGTVWEFLEIKSTLL